MVFIILFIFGLGAFLFGLYCLIIWSDSGAMKGWGCVFTVVGLALVAGGFYAYWQILLPILVFVVFIATIILIDIRVRKYGGMRFGKREKALRMYERQYDELLKNKTTVYLNFYSECMSRGLTCDSESEEFSGFAKSCGFDSFERAQNAFIMGEALAEAKRYYGEEGGGNTKELN